MTTICPATRERGYPSRSKNSTKEETEDSFPSAVSMATTTGTTEICPETRPKRGRRGPSVSRVPKPTSGILRGPSPRRAINGGAASPSRVPTLRKVVYVVGGRVCSPICFTLSSLTSFYVSRAGIVSIIPFLVRQVEGRIGLGQAVCTIKGTEEITVFLGQTFVSFIPS